MGEAGIFIASWRNLVVKARVGRGWFGESRGLVQEYI